MEPDKTAAVESTKEWNSFSQKYEDEVEHATIQSSIILYSLTKAKEYSKICEVGVGCGLASRMFISNIMKADSSYFTSDISDEMNRLYYENFEKCDSAFNPKVKLSWIKEKTDYVDTEKLIEEIGSEISRKIFVVQADNEKLPYLDSTFDLYLSSLSLMLVNNHKNQLAEAYRVLQPGGKAGFTVIGRPENSNYLSFIPDLVKACGHEIPPSSK